MYVLYNREAWQGNYEFDGYLYGFGEEKFGEQIEQACP